MRVTRDQYTDEPMLQYDDPTDIYGWPANIYSPEQLCDRVGCRCVGAEMICSPEGTRLYTAPISAEFTDLCTTRCRCEPWIDPRRAPSEPVSASDSDTDTTWSTSSNSDSGSSFSEQWAHNTAVIRAHERERRLGRNVGHPPPTCVPNRLKNCDSCLAGQAAGWTWKQSECCSGYNLQSLTPQEAYTEYGLPIDTLLASHASVGVCLKVG